MNKRAVESIDFIFSGLALVLVFLLPLFFWNITTEFYETSKFMLLFAVSGLMVILWAVRCLLEGRVTITRTPIDLPLLLTAGIFILSTVFADSKSIAILGNQARIHGGLASYILYILFYFLLVSNIRKAVIVKRIIYLLLTVGLILSVLSLLSYAGQNILGLPFSSSLNFTPTGSNFSTTALLVLLLPFLIIPIVRGSKSGLLGDKEGTDVLSAVYEDYIQNIPVKIIAAVLLTLFLAVIVLTGSMATYVASFVVLLLTLFSTPNNLLKKNIVFALVPFIIAALIALASFVQLGGTQSPLYGKAQNFPRELQLPFGVSWKVSISAFRDSPFWGTGPGSYLTTFTNYKPAEFNTTQFWNIRFDTAFNEYLHFLAIVGAPGLLALLSLTIVMGSLAFKALTRDQSVLGIALASSVLVFFVLLALHPSTLLLWVIGILLLASFMIVHKVVTEDLNIGIAATRSNSQDLQLRFDALPTFLSLISFIAVAAAVWYGYPLIRADLHHRNALNAAAAGQGLDAYNQLVAAEQLNPYSDLYRTDLAQTNFALANAIAANKGPSEASPSGSLTDEDKQNIQTLLSQAINEGRAAVALNPKNPTNWEVLGSIYRQIAGVAQNALGFSLDSYGRAIQNDPLNPNLRLIVGGIYYSIQNYDLAIRFFSDAVNLKPDFANGFYNLSIALRDKGDLQSAVAAAERTVALVDQSSPDYKTSSELLADLRAKAATLSAQAQQAEGQKGAPAPAAQTNSALQNQNLPKVLDLPKAENIATPPAVKKEETPAQQ